MNVIISNKYQTILGTLDIDVIKTVNGMFTVEELSAQFANFFYNKMIIDITAIKGHENVKVMQELSMTFDMTKVIILLDDSVSVNSPYYLSKMVSMGIYNFTTKPDVVKFLIDNPNSYKDVASYQQLDENPPKPSLFNDKLEKAETTGSVGQRIIGIKNLTEHAGATTLTYLMKKYLEKKYSVKAFELDKNDLSYFNDKSFEAVSSDYLANVLSNHMDTEVILIDVNDKNINSCTDVIYLIEPGLIKLNKLIKNDNRIFEKLKNEKLVLNKSILNEKDINDFEKESGIKIFYNIPYVDDKLDNDLTVIKFLISIGFTRLDENSEKSLFNIF